MRARSRYTLVRSMLRLVARVLCIVHAYGHIALLWLINGCILLLLYGVYEAIFWMCFANFNVLSRVALRYLTSNWRSFSSILFPNLYLRLLILS